MPYRQVLAAYATGVALNGFLPANIGTFVMLLMFVAITPGANFAGVMGGMLVQKIFFTLAGAFVYVYLFATVPGTFERQFELLHDAPLLALAIAAADSALAHRGATSRRGGRKGGGTYPLRSAVFTMRVRRLEWPVAHAISSR